MHEEVRSGLAARAMTEPIDQKIKWLAEIRKNHAADIGSIAIAWNGLHVVLGEIFVDVIAPDKKRIVLAAWSAVPNDRSKRAMLESAAVMAFGRKSKFVIELKWALGKMNRLEDSRNDAVHTPYAISMGGDEGFQFIPYVWSESPRAKALWDRDLKLEFASYLKNIDSITKFARALGKMIHAPALDPAWPKRPSLPRPAQAQVK